MAAYFFDSSAIVKRYVREVGTAWVRDITEPVAGHRLYVARLAGVEVVSALTRQGRSGNLSAAALATAMVQFRQDFEHQYHAVDITATLIIRAMALGKLMRCGATMPYSVRRRWKSTPPAALLGCRH